MKVYFFQRKKKFPRALKWAYLTFFGCWILALSFEFLTLGFELFNLLVPLSLNPLTVTIVLHLIRFCKRPFINVEFPEGFSLRLNTKLSLEELSRTVELAETGNYLYTSESRTPISEITRKSALRLARAFPLMEMCAVSEQLHFPYTKFGKWLIYSAKTVLGVFLLAFVLLLLVFFYFPYF